jgi:hypothetical protein
MVRHSNTASWWAALLLGVATCASHAVAQPILDSGQMQAIRGGCSAQICGNDNPCNAPYGCDPDPSAGECLQCNSTDAAQSCVSAWVGSTTCESRVEPTYCGLKCVLTECHVVQLYPVIKTQCTGGVPGDQDCGGEHCYVLGFPD